MTEMEVLTKCNEVVENISELLSSFFEQISITAAVQYILGIRFR